MTQSKNGDEKSKIKPLPKSQRNTHEGSLLEKQLAGFGIGGDEQPPAGQLLFEIGDLKDLVMKSDIPEQMVPVLWRLLWIAERYKVPTITKMVEYYLYVRLGKEREGRREYIETVVGEKKRAEEELENLVKG